MFLLLKDGSPDKDKRRMTGRSNCERRLSRKGKSFETGGVQWDGLRVVKHRHASTDGDPVVIGRVTVL